MKKKLSLSILSGVLAVGVLAACGDNNVENNDPGLNNDNGMNVENNDGMENDPMDENEGMNNEDPMDENEDMGNDMEDNNAANE
ncbi:hypothetical protein [Salipaludibacillus daqingensis]|uniref:hypothetical protein n=1 Tax=Salipaludibacillus daqingensis TaxID=3041001 RepID=UPI0024753346|nr:hypothetical protein [Salipaludibacillus daqingensis]